MSKILYHIRKKVWLVSSKEGVSTVNMPYGGFNSDFTVYKNTDSYLEFYVRNLDRKPIISHAKRYSITIIADDTGEHLLTRNMEIVDATKGYIRVRLFPSDIIDWPTITCRYIVNMINEDGTTTILCVDQGNTAIGYLTVADINLPSAKPVWDLVFHPMRPKDPGVLCQMSASWPGPINYDHNDPSLSLYMEMNFFSGTISVEGSNEDTPIERQSNWEIIDLSWNIGTEDIPIIENADMMDLNNCSTDENGIVVTIDATKTYKWYRVIYCPTAGNQGTINKAQLRINQ